MKDRERLVTELKSYGFIKSKKIEEVFLKVPREMFVPENLKESAYLDVPLPIPGGVTISAPHMHAIYLENLCLKENEKFLEIGCGSGILLAYAWEIIKSNSVYGIEINNETFEFCKKNLEKTGYLDKVKIFLKDGKDGLKEYAPFDKIAISASCKKIEKVWIDQLKNNGRLIAPLGKPYSFQKLTIVEKIENKIRKKTLMDVAFIELK
ncbi:MAG: protein-L-isoaspartate O-methyltransferase [Candidatus Aenigmarchaeota archaeon]|nr:protein-L-isoaspartate O-methyltransferase [Candidatus Aenigmarchaeota archaeon]MDW8149401.1 protein-L-isoaspartate O-methyltransferase [Candidatus Aenigmarchaeota archaeon]